MAFNIALSGLNAAQTDLDVKGNNIANASTTGFKRSRTEFGDLYSSGLQNLGDTSAGDGVSVQNTRQLFQQGNITATSNGLDMAIDGEGFFVLEGANGERQFSRAGQFGVDQNGFVTNNQGARVQGFQANESGQVGDVRGDLEVNTENLAPKSTTNVAANLNLDSRETVLRVQAQSYVAGGSDVNTTNTGNQGIPEAGWSYSAPDGTSEDFTSQGDVSARELASELDTRDGITATAEPTSTTLQNLNGDASWDGAQLTVNVGASNSVTLEKGTDFDNATELANALNNSNISGFNASVNSGDVELNDNEGRNLSFTLTDPSSGAGSGDFAQIDSSNGGATTLDSSDAVTAVGTIRVEAAQGYSMEGATVSGVDNNIADTKVDQTNIDRNAFDPNDPNTYNHSTSTTIYDSLGNPHEMTQYFVKQSRVGNPDNSWKSYVEIDGELVGNTSENPDGEDGFDLVFQNNGSLDTAASDDVLINDWVPKDQDGNANGAAGPNTGLTEPPLPPDSNSSNFVLDYGNTTQVGSGFAVNDLQQNGFATGRLTGLDVSEEGVIQARFSNGESEALGQIALANFRNNEGLAPVGDTAWVETIDSGDAVISRPNTGPLGAIQSSSVEESNVDLSEQLVGLITAQRNFQANSKTIETSDQITQTIINLR